MAFDSPTRNRLARLVAECRDLLTEEFDAKLQEFYGVYAHEGRIVEIEKLAHLSDERLRVARLLRERIDHILATDVSGGLKEAVKRVLREQAFTMLNRFAALRMAEERGIIVESVGGGFSSKAFKTFSEVAYSGLGDAYHRYRTFVRCLFDELAVDLGGLFDRNSPYGLLFPREDVLIRLFELLNGPDLKPLWREDETIGWVYQYYNDEAERSQMRKESPAPRNGRELAVRNQFFTPRYVVEFLTDNTLGRLWFEMCLGETALRERCRYLVRRPNEIFLRPGESVPDLPKRENFPQDDLFRQPVHIPHRPLKDPREIRLLDPACGSMHFGLYAFDLFTVIYEEAWEIAVGDDARTKSAETFAAFVTFVDDFPDKTAFLREVPLLIVEHNIHGIDIDPRAAQIAGLSLWLRAQRGWHQAGVRPADRPRITRSNLVCAEPMPGEKELLREFVDQQFPIDERPAFAFLLEKIFDRLALAGEAGSLLRIEEEIRATIGDARSHARRQSGQLQGALFAEMEPPEQHELNLRSLTDEQFWEKAEERIYRALETYAMQAENGGFQRRLFADDAAQGFAFIDVCRKRYDIVVANPPFGEATLESKDYIESQYPDSCSDLFAAFVERAIDLSLRNGFIGIISTEAGFFRRTLESWRREVLLKRSTMGVMAHLGGHVLDGATVRTATYILQTRKTQAASLFLRLLKQNEREARFLETVANIRLGIITPNVYQTNQSEFEKLPYAVFGYWCSPDLRNAFTSFPSLEETAHVRQGLATADDFRFLRLRWEIAPKSIGTHGWLLIAKGGEYSPYHDDVHLAVKWDEGRGDLSKFAPAVIRNPHDYLKSGLTYPLRTNKRFAPRLMPAGCAFGHKGPAIVDINGSAYALAALLNSRPASYLLSLALGASEAEGGAGANSYEVGLAQRLPVPRAAINDVSLADLGQKAWSIRFAPDLSDETTAQFVSPFLGSIPESVKELASTILRRDQQLAGAYGEIQIEIDLKVREFYRFSDSDWRDIIDDVGDIHRPLLPPSPEQAAQQDAARAIFHYLVGSAFGRWDIRYATGVRPAPPLPNPFAPLPICSPGMLRGDDGLPITAKEGGQPRALGAYPVNVAWDGVLVDDSEHPLDIERSVRSAIQILWPTCANDVEHETCTLLGAPSLREWIRRPTAFFAEHLRRYSKSRRQAPIYWPLSTVSGGYTLWLYYHRISDQTLFQCVNDFVRPKIASVEGDLARAMTASGDERSKRSETERLTALRSELVEFQNELLRVAQLPYKPNLNDGVIITASPLWKMFRLPKWQKDLKACWQKLENGEYDWAHLAYSIWPERVKKRSERDRSIAIAHGLESICQVKAAAKLAKGRNKKPAEEDQRQTTAPELKAVRGILSNGNTQSP